MAQIQDVMHKYGAVFYKQSYKYPYIQVSNDDTDVFQLLTGIKASAGAVILANLKSAVFLDGRYTLAAKHSIDARKFEILDYKKSTIINWINKNLTKNSKIYFDEITFSHEEMNFWNENLQKYHLDGINLKKELGICSKSRDLHIHHLENVQTTIEKRLSYIYDVISQNKLDAYLVCDPCSIAWALNIRDFETSYSNVVLCFMLVTSDHKVTLYLDESYGSNFKIFFKNTKSEHSLNKDLALYKRVGADESETFSSIKCKNLVYVKNPLILPKSVKDETEIRDIKIALKKDSAAVINFLYWFHNSCNEKITEIQAAEKMLFFRRQQNAFIGESFRCISAADEHAAMVHYSPDKNNDKIIENILLIDSGGQYKYGTTDITRTIALKNPTAEQKLFYTLVLKGHIALANAKFPRGTTGAQLDPLARQFLWQHQLDYNHSTGHGVGYALNVHEEPASISKICNIPLQPGMILTNEPGYYKENELGIRLENMMLVKKISDEFLNFEIISLIPFDLKFIEKSLLTIEEIYWLNSYNEHIISTESCFLDKAVADWLKDSSRPISYGT